MRHKVYISNGQDKLAVTPALRALIRRSIAKALEYEGFDREAEISVTLTDNDNIHRLNSEYRGVDRATDVLSFPMLEEDELDGDDGASGRVILGDIVLSLERAESQAGEYGHSFEREAAFLTVHSVLHLLGYDHETSPEDERDMFARQEAILALIGLSRGE